ncbi:hypothetical protein [Streptomyces sp. DASNCL29]|nr:hypothetical protein [Streptomyces sp. DASNCL29]
MLARVPVARILRKIQELVEALEPENASLRAQLASEPTEPAGPSEG